MRNILLLACLLAFSSCITLKEPQVRNLDNVNVSGLLSTHPKVTFDVVVFNPNSIGITMSDFSLQLRSGSKTLAEINNTTDYYAQANAEARIPLAIEPTIDQMAMLMQAGINGDGFEKFSGSGYVTVRKFLFSKKFRINF